MSEGTIEGDELPDRTGDLGDRLPGGSGDAATGSDLSDPPITDIALAGQSSEISVSADCITMINTFTVEPENQARLIEVLERATTEVIRSRPGFISANLHASVDGTRVTNYAQWASVADLEAMLADPECQPHLTECAALGEADPRVYRVSSVHHI